MSVRVQLHRSKGQRIFGWIMVGLYAGSCAVSLLVFAVGPFTFFPDLGVVRFIMPPVGVLLAVTWCSFLFVAYRLATSPPGVIELSEDELVIRDPSVFREPTRISRAGIVRVSAAPTSNRDYTVWSKNPRQPVAVTLVPETPNLLVRFSEPVVLTGSKFNQGLKRETTRQPPNPKRPTVGLWLRTADLAGRDAVLDWSNTHA